MPRWLYNLAIFFKGRIVFETHKDKLSYSIGVSTARNLRQEQVDLDLELVMKGLADGLAGSAVQISDREINAIMNNLAAELRRKGMARRVLAAEKNLREGAAFLAANAGEDGVVTLQSGVQYKILTAGEGRTPVDSDLVTCHFRGTLLDGSEFDATEEGVPVSFKLSGLVVGWKEALKLMPAGSRWQMFIPPALAYGERGFGNAIGPNETLVFDLELLAIE